MTKLFIINYSFINQLVKKIAVWKIENFYLRHKLRKKKYWFILKNGGMENANRLHRSFK